MKLLLYCTKQPPYLIYNDFSGDCNDMCVGGEMFATQYKDELWNPEEDIAKAYNGKIVGECNFEVEEMRPFFHWCRQLETATCLTYEEVLDYLDSKDKSKGNPKRQGIAYLIYIHNLNIFDEPKELRDYIIKQCQFGKCSTCEYGKNIICSTIDTPITKAPQNMMYVYDGDEKKVLISIHPKWMCKILNGEKTIEVRKKILKEML